MRQKYPKWIDDFAEAWRTSIQQHDINAHMPFNGWGLYVMFDDLWVDKLYQAITNIRKRGIKVEEIVNRLPNQSSMKFKFVEIVVCLKTSATRPERARTIADFFVEAIRARTVGEPLWMNNKIHQYANVKSIVKDKRLVLANREQASEIGKIVMGCATLGHGLYNDFCTDLGYDVYGPYDTSKVYGSNTSFLVRSFGDLNPTELWRDHAPFPYKKVTIYTVYKGVRMVPTYIACQMIYKESLVDNLFQFQVEVDRKFFNKLGELKTLREKLLATASKLYIEYKSMEFENKKVFWLYQLGYQLKKLFDIADMDWRPSQEMIDRVSGSNLGKNIMTYAMPKSEFDKKFGIEYLRKAYMHA